MPKRWLIPFPSMPRSATMPVHVVLTMSSDSVPAFARPHYATEVCEDLPRGRAVIQVETRSR